MDERDLPKSDRLAERMQMIISLNKSGGLSTDCTEYLSQALNVCLLLTIYQAFLKNVITDVIEKQNSLETCSELNRLDLQFGN